MRELDEPPFEERETDWAKVGYVWDVVAVPVQVNEDAPVRFRVAQSLPETL
jgi:hypothetical protein